MLLALQGNLPPRKQCHLVNIAELGCISHIQMQQAAFDLTLVFKSEVRQRRSLAMQENTVSGGLNLHVKTVLQACTRTVHRVLIVSNALLAHFPRLMAQCGAHYALLERKPPTLRLPSVKTA